jgi:hypothetical protein
MDGADDVLKFFKQTSSAAKDYFIGGHINNTFVFSHKR